MIDQIDIERESQLVERAVHGDPGAFSELVEPFRKPLFSYMYRMVTLRQDAEDLLQDVLVRVLESLPRFRGEARFKPWLFGIATHVCLDHLRNKKRWRTEAQLYGEREADSSPEYREQITDVLSRPDFVYEVREHIAFCFSCIGRTLDPDQQAAIMLREVLGFSNQESAAMLEVSEPVFRHRLSAARTKMVSSYEGLCQLINKTGVCWQCCGLRDLTPETHRGGDLVQIEVAPGLSVTPDNLFEARLKIVADADLAEGSTHAMHDLFYSSLSVREESRSE